MMRSRRPCVKHFSHSHPLRPVEVKEEEELICSGCELDLSGSAYRCRKSSSCCDDFYLHRSCFELPKVLQLPMDHVSGHQHPMLLLDTPPKEDDDDEYPKFVCNACGDYGTGFTYRCSSTSCQSFNLHVTCAFLPNTIKHVDHQHPLSLFSSSTSLDIKGISSSSSSSSIFTCDVCRKQVPQNCWIYYCSECDYGTDLACTTTTTTNNNTYSVLPAGGGGRIQ
ncbi:unnamed protein product [Linum trigynum]